ncbi:hypothetical protein L6452_22900 [Arctium lappa]|uniref:Uncharacterized protein n=1 Tax=Arctium lappa TaxID=4217 RepID=A0ACB9B166_ARCLA|nr:hypothetical protein L6452_22900 [Arctium lappa]
MELFIRSSLLSFLELCIPFWSLRSRGAAVSWAAISTRVSDDVSVTVFPSIHISDVFSASSVCMPSLFCSLDSVISSAPSIHVPASRFRLVNFSVNHLTSKKWIANTHLFSYSPLHNTIILINLSNFRIHFIFPIHIFKQPPPSNKGSTNESVFQS